MITVMKLIEVGKILRHTRMKILHFGNFIRVTIFNVTIFLSNKVLQVKKNKKTTDFCTRFEKIPLLEMLTTTFNKMLKPFWNKPLQNFFSFQQLYDTNGGWVKYISKIENKKKVDFTGVH